MDTHHSKIRKRTHQLDHQPHSIHKTLVDALHVHAINPRVELTVDQNQTLEVLIPLVFFNVSEFVPVCVASCISFRTRNKEDIVKNTLTYEFS